MVLTDGVFSMDGDLAPLPALSALAAAHDAWLMVDDAHGLGVLGGGRGSAHAFEPPAEVALQMGTLSKAAGGYGGYLCASQAVVDLIRTRARPFIYSTGLPPGVVAGASAALDVIEAEPGYAARPLRLAQRFAAAAGLAEAQSPIVPLGAGNGGRRRWRGVAGAGGGGVPGVGDPAAHRGGGDGAAAVHVHGAA